MRRMLFDVWKQACRYPTLKRIGGVLSRPIRYAKIYGISGTAVQALLNQIPEGKVVSTKDGVRFVYNHLNKGAILEIYGTEIYSYFDASKDDVILDLGMNVGLFSLYAAKKWSCSVVGVEAVPSTFQIALKNIGLNPHLKPFITPLNVAVVSSSQSGSTVKLFVPGGAGSGYASIVPPERTPLPVSQEKALGVSLSELIQKYNPTMLKCDVEGAEWEIFDAQALKAIKNSPIRKIVIETHEFFANGQGIRSTEELIGELERIGFSLDYKLQLNKGLWMIYLTRPSAPRRNTG